MGHENIVRWHRSDKNQTCMYSDCWVIHAVKRYYPRCMLLNFIEKPTTLKSRLLQPLMGFYGEAAEVVYYSFIVSAMYPAWFSRQGQRRRKSQQTWSREKNVMHMYISPTMLKSFHWWFLLWSLCWTISRGFAFVDNIWTLLCNGYRINIKINKKITRIINRVNKNNRMLLLI